MPPRAEIDLYDRFLNLSREAFAAGNFSAAFHGLAAALHCAETLRDVDRLQIIAEEAERQLGVIDAEHPHHRIGSAAAARRGHSGMYRSLLTQLGAATAIASSPPPHTTNH